MWFAPSQKRKGWEPIENHCRISEIAWTKRLKVHGSSRPLQKQLAKKDGLDVIVDAVRISAQVEKFRAAFGPAVVHVHLWASEGTLQKRFEARKQQGRNLTQQ